MNSKEIKERNYNLFVEFVDGLNVLDDSISYHVKLSDFDEVCTFDWITRLVESNGGLSVDFCDTNKAAQYLAEFDPSLEKSLYLYREMECPTPDECNVDSCTFASRLATEELAGEWYYHHTDIEEFLENLDWEEDEDDSEEED